MADIADQHKDIEFGASDYIVKPFRQQEVLTKIKTQLQISRLPH
ncbi:hypothetical protein [Thalassoporum mexicanum]|nr:hypothetical protein [Pseudanabaena sp. PCC 7367]